MTSTSDTEGILYLSAADVQACAITPAEMTAAVESAFQEAARGTATTKEEMSIPVTDGERFRAKGGVLRGAGYGGVKWYGYFPGNLQHGQPEYRPLIILNEARFGFTVAIMNGDWITAHRTAAITAVGAKWLARPESSRVGFVGCGWQARANFEALLPLFPIVSAIACSRRIETAEAFAKFCRENGVAAEATTDPRNAVSEADIVVTSVPQASTRTPFLEAAWVAPGSFVSMVDVGRSWKPDGLASFTSCFTDEMQQARHRAQQGGVSEFDAGLAEVIGGLHSGRKSPEDRIALIFSGTGLADVAAAALVYERARALGRGTLLAA
jgi:ornithine cyclodeaminase/alanine dehydrogenase-like protein (mu-crystallin family)